MNHIAMNAAPFRRPKTLSVTAWALILGTVATSQNDSPDAVRPADRSGIHAAFHAARHAVRPSGGGFEARNDGQRWTTRFDGRGFTVVPDAGSWTWGLELSSHGAADGQQFVSDRAGIRLDASRVTYEWSETFEEWFVNDARGLEHGYTVRERPVGQASLELTLLVRGDLEANVSADGRDVRFVDANGRAVVDYAGLTVFDADGEVLPARFDAGDSRLLLSIDDTGARYPLTIDPVAQQAYLKASNTNAGDVFGWTVAVDGDTAVVGAWGERSSATGVDGDESDNSKFEAGAAYVFVRSGSTWSQQAYLKASNTDLADRFGWSVAISGDTIVVGAPYEMSLATGVNGDESQNAAPNVGAAYVFVRSGTTWSQQAYLKASNSGFFDAFGHTVAIDSDTIVVGAYKEDSWATGVNGDQADNSKQDSGAAYVFVRSGSSWSQQAYLKASNTGAGDAFGQSVAVSGDTVVVGADKEDSDLTGINGVGGGVAVHSGAAYVFVRSGSSWSQQAYVKASNTDADDWFGSSVSISGDTCVIGAPQEDSSATGIDGNEADNGTDRSGAAYVFLRTGTTWAQQSYLKASNTGTLDSFGTVVAIDGDSLVVSSPYEFSNATGIDGDESDNSASGAGAAYLFTRSGATWSQQAYLKASNTESEDRFGTSAAISGDTVIAGAPQERSSATGVGGNESDNSAMNAGAAYVFAISDLDGCPGAGQPTLTAPASATSSWGIDCPAPTTTCSFGPVILFGECSPIALPVPPPIGCGVCGLLVNPSWGTLSDGAIVGPGLLPGFTFCVQCGCVANAGCIDLSRVLEIVVGP